MGGKGKGGGKGHTLPRQRLSAEKFSGTVVAWKGKYGWIQPAEEIAHEKASMNKGSLFASINDVMSGVALEEGATVEFHICEDESGLGAEEVVQTSAGNPQAAGGKNGTKGGAKGGWGAGAGAKGKAAGQSWTGDKGGAKGWDGAKGGWDGGAAAKGGWGGGWDGAGAKGWADPAAGKGGAKGWGSPMGAKGVMSSFNSWGVKGGDKGDKGGKSKGKGKGKSKEGGKGHLLPRNRITAEKFSGTVAAWKGKYGWITPSDEIEHEKAKLHKGVFVSKDDLVDITELTVGASVEFHICEDASGLGAEEVVQL